MKNHIFTAVISLMFSHPVESLAQISQDYVDNLLWFAEQGDALAQSDVANLYFNGLGVFQDYDEAYRWARKAAEQGYAGAQMQLTVAHYLGYGAAQDYTTAFMWSIIAAANLAEGAAETKDIIATQVTNAQALEARERAQICMGSKYSKCD